MSVASLSSPSIPAVMGVLNITPDSFSDGGRFVTVDAAVAHGIELFAQGAAVVDVGGASTRPGAEPVDPVEELRRVQPVIEALAGHGRLSIDTRDGDVARAAVASGASLINDVSAALWPVAADLGVGWVAMHMLGDPRTMQVDPRYDDVVDDVAAFLDRRATDAVAAGVDEVWIDPGIGFGKTIEHNLALLANLDRLVALGFPVLVGTSRKAFLGRLSAQADGHLDPTPTDDRMEGSVATATAAFALGAAMVRAHEVRPCVEAARVVAA